VRSAWWPRLLQLVLLLVVGWGIYDAFAPRLRELNWNDLARYRPAVLPLVVSTALLLTVYAMHALIWRRITEALGNRPVELRSAMHVYFVSGLGRYLPGKLWQIAGMAVLAQRFGIPPLAATAASLLAQLGFLTMGMIFLAVLLPSQFGWEAALAALVMIALASALFVIGGTHPGRRLRHRLLSRFGPKVADAATLLDRLTVSRAAVWWAAYGLSWVILGGAFVVFVNAFVPGSSEHVVRLMGAVAASYLVGLMFFTPAGIGVREGLMLPLLAALIPLPAAVVVSITSRIWFTLAELLPLAAIPLLPQPAALPADQAGKA
jgi:uncharacterized membrane protein YbhN (UPF0104 family)